MKKSDINLVPEYFERYINLVADVELAQAFDESIRQLDELDANVLEENSAGKSAPGKWTTKAILQHVIDFERILSYRALLFARRENSVPQSIDQDLLAANANVENRSIKSLIAELKAVRLSTKALFESFDDAALQSTGTNWKFEISVLALGFAMLGHQIHHLKMIKKRFELDFNKQ